jgi:hypothetical protein
MNFKILGEEGCLTPSNNYLRTLPYINARKHGHLDDLLKIDEKEKEKEF